MTKTVLPLVFMFSLSASATPVVTAVSDAGFVPNPQRKTFTLDSSGQMTLEIHIFRSGTSTIKNLGQLSADVMASLVADFANIDPSAKLVDEREGQPMCTDAPSSTVSVIPEQTKPAVVVRRYASCHTWYLSTYQAQTTADLALLFLRL